MYDRQYPDLDYEFLRYTGVVPENQRRIQSHYLPYFEDCKRVLDVACGDGDFVEMLTEQGVQARGVDYDPKACEAVRSRGLDVVCQDLFTYLEQVEPESIDGVFAAHLVEHLNYKQVLKMADLSMRALVPGGIILVVTPNVRSAYAHLESFYKHFGHCCFYHPELLCFFLDYVGFVEPQIGENPHVAAPLWGPADVAEQLRRDLAQNRYGSYERDLPVRGSNPLRRLFREVKMFAVRMIVQPYIDQVMARVNELAHRTVHVAQLEENVRVTLDRPVECYVYAYKPADRKIDTGRANPQP